MPKLYISGLKITPLLREQAVEIDWEIEGDLEELLEEGLKVFLNLEAGFQGRNISGVKVSVSRTHGRTRLFSVIRKTSESGESWSGSRESPTFTTWTAPWNLERIKIR